MALLISFNQLHVICFNHTNYKVFLRVWLVLKSVLRKLSQQLICISYTFIFLLASVHVIYCFVTMTLALKKVKAII